MKQVASNKKVFHEYDILEKFCAGIVLSGDEIKSVRNGGLTLSESFGVITSGEIFLLNAQISPYSKSFREISSTDAKRKRKLLLNKKEVKKILGEVSKKGVTIVPLRGFINQNGFLKIEIGLARHKKVHNRKQELKERDISRQAQRDLKSKY